ncbi:J domain-containing protein [Marinobacter halodurans]|uniref:J domain-containing protein n=1 Tax=Marinobacter halodurans TaxID=2528979 RepID=A0ABY1ZPL1_9GAMM|nr:J domain-containing protein [Marinobacter halodurans]TBW56003.1 J domain-containing protein [Marinobacter halodurans]
MTCWEVLGISPTNNRERIEKAYASQRKFATGEALSELDDAYRQALREGGFAVSEPSPEPETPAVSEAPASGPTPALDARDQQVVREIVLQVDAMLNDSHRRSDPNIWRAILTEPPGDRDVVREAASDALYPRLKPYIDDGSLPQPVLAFLSQWFGWPELDEAELTEERSTNDPFDDPLHRGPGASQAENADGREKRQPMISFWPAAIGWIAGLIILTSIFSHILGS